MSTRTKPTPPWCVDGARKGLHLRTNRGHPEVAEALIRFARWLREHYRFPIRVPVYLHPKDHIVTMHGERAVASFFAPWDSTVEPYIRIATGDYPEIKQRRGRDNALAEFISCLAHEVIHYQQWVRTGKTSEHGVDRRASAWLDRYAQTVDAP